MPAGGMWLMLARRWAGAEWVPMEQNGSHGAVGAQPGVPWGAWGSVCAFQMSWGMHALSPLSQFVTTGRLRSALLEGPE